MEAKDLRIGNNMIAYGKIITISTSDLVTIDLYHSKGEAPNYKPIPLTDEWLLKFGFEDVNKDDRNEFNFTDITWQLHKDRIINIYQELSKEPYIFRSFPVGEVGFYWYADIPPVVEIKFVHQLQNLYFALTGNELTINE